MARKSDKTAEKAEVKSEKADSKYSTPTVDRAAKVTSNPATVPSPRPTSALKDKSRLFFSNEPSPAATPKPTEKLVEPAQEPEVVAAKKQSMKWYFRECMCLDVIYNVQHPEPHRNWSCSDLPGPFNCFRAREAKASS